MLRHRGLFSLCYCIDRLPLLCCPNHWLSLIIIVELVQHVQHIMRSVWKKHSIDSNLTHVPLERMTCFGFCNKNSSKNKLNLTVFWELRSLYARAFVWNIVIKMTPWRKQRRLFNYISLWSLYFNELVLLLTASWLLMVLNTSIRRAKRWEKNYLLSHCSLNEIGEWMVN